MDFMYRRKSEPPVALVVAPIVALVFGVAFGAVLGYQRATRTHRGPRSHEHRQSPLPDFELGAMHADGWDDNAETSDTDSNVVPMRGSLTGEHAAA